MRKRKPAFRKGGRGDAPRRDEQSRSLSRAGLGFLLFDWNARDKKFIRGDAALTKELQRGATKSSRLALISRGWVQEEETEWPMLLTRQGAMAALCESIRSERVRERMLQG